MLSGRQDNGQILGTSGPVFELGKISGAIGPGFLLDFPFHGSQILSEATNIAHRAPGPYPGNTMQLHQDLSISTNVEPARTIREKASRAFAFQHIHIRQTCAQCLYFQVDQGSIQLGPQSGPLGQEPAQRLNLFGIRRPKQGLLLLEMLDFLNEKLILEGADPVAFESDCREGICGMCGAVVNGRPHGPEKGTTLCQLHMRHFKNGDTIVIEPWRARPFPVIKDLVVDRGALDTIIQAGGFISVNTGGVPDANAIPIAQHAAEKAMDAAACIGCGACVAACPNAAVMLFLGAKISHLALLPQGRPEAARRVLNMLQTTDHLGFGNCTNERECEVECPKEISIVNIARLNREFLKAAFLSDQT